MTEHHFRHYQSFFLALAMHDHVVLIFVRDPVQRLDSKKLRNRSTSMAVLVLLIHFWIGCEQLIAFLNQTYVRYKKEDLSCP